MCSVVIATPCKDPLHSGSSRAMFFSMRTIQIHRERLNKEKPPDFGPCFFLLSVISHAAPRSVILVLCDALSLLYYSL